MKVTYFPETDTLHIEFRPSDPGLIAESRELDENTVLDLDEAGNICGMTIEHAQKRTDAPHLDFEQVTSAA